MYHLMTLPYSLDALEPYISRETLEYHYNKHHRAYVNQLNHLLPDDPRSLEELVKTSSGAIFNQAAQVWNHNFYWHSMSAQHHQTPMNLLKEAIDTTFQDYQNFCAAMNTAALSQFGSGWAWLVAEDHHLKIVTTSNADTPLRLEQHPLLVIDVWEHAYYIDVRNRRADYLNQFWHVANWAFAEQNYLRYLETQKSV